jgi:hypothetical protein
MYLVKQCTKCKEYKLLEEYSNRKQDGVFGKNAQCKICERERSKLYHYKNREVILERKKKYEKQNRHIISIKQKKYREENKDVIRERKKEFGKKNREKLSKYSVEYHKKRKQTDPIFKMKCNISSRISESMKRQGYTKRSKTYQILGCDFDTFKKHIERQFTKGMNWNNQGEWHFDHIVPISSAQTEEQVIELNHYTNFQPLWAEDNLRKSNKIKPTQIKLRI